MRHVVADTETDGLLEELTKLHCLVLRDLETGVVVSCTDSAPEDVAAANVWMPLAYGLSILSKAERIYFHNGIGFDLQAIRKVYPGWTYSGEMRDTLIMARLRWGHIKDEDMSRVRRGAFPAKLVGSHSLEAWGVRLDVLKGDKEKQQWAVWTPEMQAYCEQDTAVGAALVNYIRRYGDIPKGVIECEHALALYLGQQERNGFPFDLFKAIKLQATLAAERERWAQELREQYGTWLVADGAPKTPKKTIQYKEPRRLIVAGAEYQNIKQVEFNPGSRDHLADRLQKVHGWKPTEFTEGGKPKVDEDVLLGVKLPGVESVLKYLALDKRLGQLSEGSQGWIRKARVDGQEGGTLTGMYHVHGRCNQNGAVTHRATHSNPNLSQTPKVGSLYGAECRELFTVPPGWLMVGTDMSGLELRCLAHYMARYDGGEYAKVILEGDPHTVTRDALSLDGKEGRDTAKTWYYAYLYGGGDVKLGSILEPGASLTKQATIGKKARSKFEREIAALGYLVAALKEKVRNPGYLILIDGRRSYIRHQHAALNTLLQGTGAVLSKHWIVDYDKVMTQTYGEQGWLGKWAALIWSHDEIQVAVRTQEIAEAAGKIAVASIEQLTERFRFRCPLTGQSAIGKNWKATH